jgi:hypothetical protein
MNKAVVQICALCWLFLLRLIMHGTNIKFLRCLLHVSNPRGSSSGRRLHVPLWCNLFTWQLYKQYCRWNSTACYGPLMHNLQGSYAAIGSIYFHLRGTQLRKTAGKRLITPTLPPINVLTETVSWHKFLSGISTLPFTFT